MILTDQQKAAVRHDGHAVLVACPGSGKTRTVIAKLLRSVAQVRETTRRVACITYTNTAVDEITARIRQYGASNDEEYCDVSTIHAFCQNNILRHFYWKIAALEDGFSVLPADAALYQEIVTSVADEYGIGSYERQLFESLNRRPNGEPITPRGIPQEAAVEFWERLQSAGYVDFCNLVYLSYQILRHHPSARRSVAARYAFVLVDEFQDTSALQVEILRLLFQEALTEFFLVGDPEQSIYSFAGAERRLMFDFAKEIGAQEFPLSGNYRCGPSVVSLASKLISRTPEMLSAGMARHYKEAPVYAHCQSDFNAITDEFLPRVDGLKIPLGECGILAPSWYQLLPLGNKLREYGVAVVGPGARPYKKRHLFASLAEQVCAYIERPRPEFVPSAERELFFLSQNVTGKANFRIFSYDGRRVLYRLLQEGQKLSTLYEGAREWLRAAAETFGIILHEEDVLPTWGVSLLQQSVEDMLQDMIDRKVDVANLTLPGLGMFANPADNLKLMTFHGAKGREFTAVCIVALQDGLIPYHNKFNTVTQDGLEEARRLFYVAVTRAKCVLVLATNAGDWRPPCRFLAEIGMCN